MTTMLTATPELSLRRPATTSVDLAAATEEAAAEDVEAVRTGSPTYLTSMLSSPAVVNCNDSLRAASSVALDGMERPAIVMPTDTTSTPAEGADVGSRVGLGVRTYVGRRVANVGLSVGLAVGLSVGSGDVYPERHVVRRSR